MSRSGQAGDCGVILVIGSDLTYPKTGKAGSFAQNGILPLQFEEAGEH